MFHRIGALATIVSGLCLCQDLAAVEKSWASKVLVADTAALALIMTDDIIYAHASGVIDTKASYLKKLKSKRQVYRTLEHQKKLETRVYGDTAITHGVVRVTGINPAGNFDDTVMMIHVWVKRAGEWRLAAHQTTKIK